METSEETRGLASAVVIFLCSTNLYFKGMAQLVSRINRLLKYKFLSRNVAIYFLVCKINNGKIVSSFYHFEFSYRSYSFIKIHVYFFQTFFHSFYKWGQLKPVSFVVFSVCNFKFIYENNVIVRKNILPT